MNILTLRQKLFSLVILILFLIGSIWLYKAQEHQYKVWAQDTLVSLAELKADQIVEWRNRRLKDGAVLQDRPVLMGGVNRFLTTSSKEDTQFITAMFASIQHHYDYDDVVLTDPEGHVLLSLAGRKQMSAEFVKTIPAAIRHHRPLLTDLHIPTGSSEPEIAAIFPVYDQKGRGQKVVGVMGLVSKASSFLYPLLEKWHTRNMSPETILVRKEDDSVLVLNNLRHKPDAALNFSIPLSSTESPIVKAVIGKTGFFEGKDYRGVDVVTVIMPVQGSNWLIEAKEDKSRVFAQWRTFSIILSVLFLSIIGMLAASGMFLLKREEKNHFRKEYESETALRQSIERQSIILRSIGDAVIAADAHGRVEMLNSVAEELTGWSSEDAKGMPMEMVFRIVNEYSREAVESPVVKVLREGIVVGLANHTLLIAKDGREIPIADSGAPIENEKGEVTGVVLVFRDQTAERMAEKKLLEHKNKLEAILDAGELGYWVWDISTNISVYNERWAYMLGYEMGELSTDASLFLSLLHPDDRPKLLAILKKHIEGSLSRFEEEFRVKTKDGRWIWLYDAGRVIEWDESGKPLVSVGIHQDITERKEAEKKLRESEERFRTMIEGAPDAIFIQIDQKFAYLNEKAMQLFGADHPSKLLGVHVLDRIHPEYHEIVNERLGLLYGASKFFTKPLEEKFIRLDGDEVWVEVSAHSITYEGSPGALVFVRDITERKALEHQLLQAQKMESVGRLAGGVAHDFNNMLGVIIGYAEIALSKMAADDPLRSGIQEIHKTAKRSADLTKQLLAFARKQIISPKVLDLNKTVESMLKMLQRLMGEDIDLLWLPASNLWNIKLDPAQVEQVLANLCVNSRDAISGVGKVTIETGNIVFDEEFCAQNAGFIPGEYVQLLVSDTGRGMEKEVLKKAFEPFFTTKDVGKGTGLGLATVYGIVQQNNGFIKIYSEPGHGTTIKIFFAKNTESDSEPVSAPDIELQHGRGETVLIVEDEPSILVMAKIMLETLGYKVLTANRPNDAIRIASEHGEKINLLITDVIMPEMNGRDLSAKMLGFYPGLKLLFMSGYTADVIAQHGMLDEGVNFVQKPFSVKVLAAKVREVLDKN
ncbi:MAG: PAS domain S-box protein [Dissulfurispiraceae bacterium]|jgi:PAS domain S-box-containing protein|nr:PAS domain S-box protein [Dissulfurispiraceae bacterium]